MRMPSWNVIQWNIPGAISCKSTQPNRRVALPPSLDSSTRQVHREDPHQHGEGSLDEERADVQGLQEEPPARDAPLEAPGPTGGPKRASSPQASRSRCAPAWP